jgi:curved DNA-binding protein
MNYKDYYQTLGVSKDAGSDDIKKAYRRLAVKYHPDKNQGDKQAEERFKEISEAYQVLHDPQKRKKYDALGANWKQYENAGTDGYWSSSRTGASNEGESFVYEGNLNDLFGGAGSGGGFSDFFNAFFESGSRKDSNFQNRNQSFKGNDLHAELNITLAEAWHGTARILNTGKEKLRISINPGAYNGQELRIKGKGAPGIHGGSKGDIYIKLKIIPDARYQLEGNDLLQKIDVDLYTAVLGGKMEINTLEGNLNVEIPKGSQNGSKLRLKGKGMPLYGKQGKYGDLYIQLNVRIPDNLNSEESQLFNRLKELNDEK